MDAELRWSPGDADRRFRLLVDVLCTGTVRLAPAALATAIIRREIDLVAEFDLDLRVRSIGPRTDYDLLAQFLVDKGFLEAIPDRAYWQPLVRTFRHWTGDDWVVDSAVVNRHYLDALRASPEVPRDPSPSGGRP